MAGTAITGDFAVQANNARSRSWNCVARRIVNGRPESSISCSLSSLPR